MSFLLVLALFAWLGGGAAWAQVDASSTGLRIAGVEEIVFSHSRDACEIWDIPDLPARAFRDAQGRVQLIASHYISRRMIGSDFHHLRQDCRVIMRSGMDPDPSKFYDHEWMAAVYSPDGRMVYALIHDEYHGWEHPGQCTSKVNFDCWYNALSLAVSRDRGNSYARVAAPPGHLVAAVPYPYQRNMGTVGIFSPSNIIHSEQDGYYYAFFKSVKPYGSLPAHSIGVMRTRDLSDPASWRAWGGREFDIRFINPYLEPDARPEEHIFSPLSPRELADMLPHSVTYNTFLKRYLMVGAAHVKDPAGQMVWAIAYSLSEDLIHWSPRRFLKEIIQPANFSLGGPDPVAYPSALDPQSPSRNFETTGKKFYIYFTRFNYNRPKRPFWTADRDLLRVPVEFRAP